MHLGLPAVDEANRDGACCNAVARVLLSRTVMRTDFVICFLVSCFALACGREKPADIDTGPRGADGAAGTASDGADGGGAGSSTEASSHNDGTLVLLAVGGPPGEVSAAVDTPQTGGQGASCNSGPLDGACQLTSCQLTGTTATAMAGYDDFGPISVAVGATTVLLTYDQFGYSTGIFPSSITLGAGGTMRFHGGNGASVPTFDVTATIPDLAVFTSPAPAPDGGAVSIDSSQDLSVTWSPISIGQAQFRLNAYTAAASPSGLSAGTAISVACTFEGTSGSGIVPHALLSSVKGMSATATVSSGLVATTVVDGLTIVIRSSQSSPTNGRDFDVTVQ